MPDISTTTPTNLALEQSPTNGIERTVEHTLEPVVEPESTKISLSVGASYTKPMWYFAMPSNKLKRGKMVSKTILEEPLLIGRDENGVIFALRDVCPHQGIPLTKGNYNGKEIECCFHGWRFNNEGTCTAIPSLLEDQEFNVCSIKTKNYICVEDQGCIWIYFGDKTANLADISAYIPRAPGLKENNFSKTITTLRIPTHIDYAVLALIDTSHVPYVHKSWWWRSSRNMKRKEKKYVPSGNGWTMVRHHPSKHSHIFKLIGDLIETEISFRLPGCRIEHITVGGKTLLSGITTLTAVDELTTELNHTTYWTIPWIAPFIRPIINYFVHTFLSQDLEIATAQAPILAKRPNLILTIKDSGTPGAWYFKLKQVWMEAHAQNRPFKNPIKESILRWWT
jgi:phenylpropionate dioxygenase-like ring-hydroxylating dioxygenase large terminal subunit